LGIDRQCWDASNAEYEECQNEYAKLTQNDQCPDPKQRKPFEYCAALKPNSKRCSKIVGYACR
jgi:hypothetical protein